MTGLDDLILLRPAWLLALGPVLVALVWALRRRRPLGGWDRALDPALLAAMRALGRIGRGTRPLAILLPGAAAVGIVLALSGPAAQKRDVTAFRNLDGVVLVMDLSRSVTEDPRWNDTITAARIVLQSIGAKPASLVVYGGDAYLAAAMTADTAALELTVAALEADTMPDPGSRPGLGLALAAQILGDMNIIAGDVVVIGDGGGIDAEALRAATALADGGARVSTLQAPSLRGADPDALGLLAEAGGGWALPAAQAADLGGRIAGGLSRRLEALDYALLIRADLGRYLLLLALIPVLISMRRGAA